jgi:hypothetical protein
LEYSISDPPFWQTKRRPSGEKVSAVGVKRPLTTVVLVNPAGRFWPNEAVKPQIQIRREVRSLFMGIVL